jgi:hypothetical protein
LFICCQNLVISFIKRPRQLFWTLPHDFYFHASCTHLCDITHPCDNG